MMDDIMEDNSEIHDNATNFLPDLTEGQTFEQICFVQKVIKANKMFVSIRKDIIRWIISHLIIALILNPSKVTNTHSSKIQRSILMIASRRSCYFTVFAMME